MKETLQAFSTIGSALLEAHEDQASLSDAVQNAGGWSSLEGLVATAAQLTDTLAADPLAYVVHGYHRFRRYAPRMLRALNIHAAQVAEPLLVAAGVVAGTETTVIRPLTFLRRTSKWHRHLTILLLALIPFPAHTVKRHPDRAKDEGHRYGDQRGVRQNGWHDRNDRFQDVGQQAHCIVSDRHCG